MNLREMLRSDFRDYIRPIIVKDKCEFCGGIEHLHLHHVNKFHNLLMETLEELKLQELDTQYYDNMELKSIRNFMLAKQIQCDYKTLCEKCHMKLHGSEKYNEEYKEHYYNPYGGYVNINVAQIKALNLDSNVLFRFIYLASNTNYDGMVININKYSNNKIKKDELIDIFKISKSEFYNTLNCLIEFKLITIDENKYIKINQDYISRGFNNYGYSSKVFIKNIIDLYLNINPKKHKIMGDFIKICTHSKYGILECNTKELLKIANIKNSTRLLNYINEYEVFIVKFNNKFIINPYIWYDKGLDYGFKKDMLNFNAMITTNVK